AAGQPEPLAYHGPGRVAQERARPGADHSQPARYAAALPYTLPADQGRFARAGFPPAPRAGRARAAVPRLQVPYDGRQRRRRARLAPGRRRATACRVLTHAQGEERPAGDPAGQLAAAHVTGRAAATAQRAAGTHEPRRAAHDRAGRDRPVREMVAEPADREAGPDRAVAGDGPQRPAV